MMRWFGFMLNQIFSTAPAEFKNTTCLFDRISSWFFFGTKLRSFETSICDEYFCAAKKQLSNTLFSHSGKSIVEKQKIHLKFKFWIYGLSIFFPLSHALSSIFCRTKVKYGSIWMFAKREILFLWRADLCPPKWGIIFAKTQKMKSQAWISQKCEVFFSHSVEMQKSLSS